MKRLDLTTSKGKFAIIDCDDEGKVKHPPEENIEISRIINLTEEQAAEIVDSSIHTGLFAHYVEDIPVNTYCYEQALDSLVILIESKGYHLFTNPIQYIPDKITDNHTNLDSQELITKYYDAKDKVLVNPIIFKLT